MTTYGGPMVSGDGFSARALDYLAERAIDPEIAKSVGVREESGTLIFGDTGRRRSLKGVAAKVLGAKGVPLRAWWPTGPPQAGGVDVLVTEGESDALAALSALPRTPPPAGIADLKIVAVPGVGFPVDRLVRELAELRVRGAVLAFDADDAGRRYQARVIEALRAGDIEPISVELPEGADLADFLALRDGDGPDALANLLADAAVAAEAKPSDEIGELLGAIRDVVRRFVALPGEAEYVVASLFAAHTWAFGGAYATPYLLVLSPERRAGKTRLLEVLELVCARPWRVVGASEAAIFRKLAADQPTLLLDEVDALFGSMSERTEPLRAILNAGNRDGASVARCVGEKGDRVRDFPVFAPKVLAGIDTGRLPDTIRDRAIPIAMKRRTASERVERFQHRKVSAETAGLREALEAWAETAVEELEAAEPELPETLDDRAAEAWEALLAIADQAGGEWPEAARAAATQLNTEGEAETSRGAALLGAIRAAFDGRDRMSTAEILEHVNVIEELPFGGWRDGKGLDGRGLAKLLRPYGVRPPKVIRMEDGSTPRGYPREAFAETWERWLPTPLSGAQQAQQAQQATVAATEEPHGKADVADVADVAATSRGGGSQAASGGSVSPEGAFVQRAAAA